MSTTKWIADPTHSQIGFKVKHMMFTNVNGKFETFEATIESDGDNFENSNMRFSGDIASISTGNADRDAHLKGADFFNGDESPKITFTSASVTKTSENEFEVAGDLSLRGVTKPVRLQAEFGGIMKDPFGNTKAAFSITGKINRKDWGLTWNAALETGGVLVSDEVRLDIELQFVRQ
ncbi:MAG TPA: YceI family protein [Flavobacterium sp.]|jgi:polyisoprenoid-binding protein YceI